MWRAIERDAGGILHCCGGEHADRDVSKLFHAVPQGKCDRISHMATAESCAARIRFYVSAFQLQRGECAAFERVGARAVECTSRLVCDVADPNVVVTDRQNGRTPRSALSAACKALECCCR